MPRSIVAAGAAIPVADAVNKLPRVSALAPKRSAVMLTPRVPRRAGDVVTAGGSSGSGSYTCPRSALDEAIAWGADNIGWCYFSSASASDVNSWKASGRAVHGTINTSPSLPGTTVLPTDWAGNPWSAGTNPARPAPFQGQAQRMAAWIDFATLCDSAEAARKVAEANNYAAMGASSIQVDDPRDMVPWIAQSMTHPQMAAGFRVWLLANTTLGDRTAAGLPTTLPADLVAWLTTDNTCPWYSWFHTGLTVPSDIDAYAGRVRVYQLTAEPDRRPYQIFFVWYGQYMRDTINAVYASIKAACGLPLSGNLFRADPAKEKRWLSSSFDWAVFEGSEPTYPYALSTRLDDITKDWLTAMTLDGEGKQAIAQWIPIKPNSAPAAQVITVGRQTIAQYYAWGISPTPPWDVYMQASQGVAVDGYRFFGAYADYVDLFQFARSKAALLDGFYAIPDIGLLAASDQFPDALTSGQETQYATMLARVKSLMQAGIRPLLQRHSSEWEAVTPSKTMPATVSVSGSHEFRGFAKTAYSWAENWTAVDVQALASKYARVLVNDGGAGSVLAWPRYNPATGQTVVHLTNYLLSGNAPAQVSATLSGPLIDGKSFVVHRPGYAAVSMSPGSAIPVDQWSIVELL